MKCIKCGKEYSDNVKFCSVCGEKIEENNESTSFWDEDVDNKFDNTIKISDDLLKDIEEQKVNFNNEIIENNTSEIELNNEKLSSKDIDRDFYGNDFKVKKSTIFFVVLIIISILSLIGGVLYFISKPKNTLMLSLYKYSSKLKNNYLKNYNSLSGNYNIDYELKDLSGKYKDIIDDYNDFTLSGTYGIDIKRKVANLEFGSSYKDKEFINGNIFNNDNEFYLYFEKVFDKYIKYDSKNKINLYDKFDNKDYTNIVNALKDTFISSLKEEYVVKYDDVINGKNVNKVNIKIDKNNYKEIVIEFLNSLKNNEQFINSINDISNKDIKEVIDKIIIDLNNKEFKNVFDIDFYISKFSYNLIKLEVKMNNKIIIDINEDNININNKILKILLNKEDNKYKIDITSKDINLKFNLELTNKYNTTVKNKDVSNYIDVKEVKDNELEIITNLSKREGFINFYNKINLLEDNKEGILKKISIEELDNKILNKETFLLAIGRDGCPYCKEYYPKFEQVSKELKINSYYIESNSNEEVNKINSIINYEYTPTTIMFIDGKENLFDDRIVGDTQKENIEKKVKQFKFIISNLD